MYDKIEAANLPVERLLYVASKIEVPLKNRQRRVLESRFDVKIEQNQFTFVTAFTSKGKRYSVPADLERGDDGRNGAPSLARDSADNNVAVVTEEVQPARQPVAGNGAPSLARDSADNDVAVVTEEVQPARQTSVADNRRDSPKKRRRARLHDSETASDQ
uniref:SPK domain-containing protein n=1 Tax=Ascaris lumbricoides TaxID=6252 RepID=A0A0M3IRE1_ASCLU